MRSHPCNSFLTVAGVAPEAAIIGREIRQLWVGKARTYRILFVVESDTIAILHIRHRRQAPLGTEPPE
jgi:hypothetical protein